MRYMKRRSNPRNIHRRPRKTDMILQQPAARAEQLILLYHGVGGEAAQMAPLGELLAGQFPQAFIVSVQAPHECDFASGWQWFSVRDITDANRPERVAAAMPTFVDAITRWQQTAGVNAEATALIGFSQGGIMALESTKNRAPLAGRVVALGSRFAALPEVAIRGTTFHLLHGKEDAVMPYAHTVAAAERLVALGCDVTADVIPFIGHSVDLDMVSLLIERLRNHLPARRWEEALRSAATLAPGARAGVSH